MRRLTAAPLCNPTPRQLTGARSVCSEGKLFQMNRLHPEAEQLLLFFCHRNVVKWKLLLLLVVLVVDELGSEVGIRGTRVVGDIGNGL